MSTPTPTVTVTLTLPELDLIRDYFIHCAMDRDVDYGDDLPTYLTAYDKLTKPLVAAGITPQHGRSLP